MTFPKKFRTVKGLFSFNPYASVEVLFIDATTGTVTASSHPATIVGTHKASWTPCTRIDIWEPVNDISKIKYNLKEAKCVK